MTRWYSVRHSTIDVGSDPMAPPAYRIQAMIDGLDQVAHAMERKWGVGRLRLLVSDLLCAKFDEQKDRLDAAIASDEERYVRIHADAMRRAWQALDRAAVEAGEKPLAPEVWECVLPDTGEVVSIVRDEAEAHHIARECRVFTLAEVAKLIAGLGEAAPEIKRRIPVAAISGIRRKPPIDWSRGDDIPF